MPDFILAHDIGTSASKSSLVREDGTIVASVSHPYPTTFLSNGGAEQDPEDWWRAVCANTRKLVEMAGSRDIVAIALSGMMMGCLPVDRNGRPLRNHLLYCDQRAIVEAERFGRAAGADRVYRISGNRPSAVNSAPKLMWVKDNEPDTYEATWKFLNAKDFINYRFTGRFATDPTDASGTNLYDLEAWKWSEELVDAAGLDADRLPDIVPSTEVLGTLTEKAAGELSLKSGIPVVTGAADGVCAGVGAGSVKPGRTYICLGSSAWVGITSEGPVYDSLERSITFAHAVPGLFQPMGTMLAGGSLYSWLRQQFFPGEDGVTFREMDEIARQSRPGARGLLFLPHLMGERSPRWNSLARGGWLGLDIVHTRADMFRAVLESVALNLEITVSIFRAMGTRIDDITMIGGGSKGELWRRIMADITGADILQSSNPDEATTVGAAVVAGVGIGLFPDFSVVDKLVPVASRLAPDAATRQLHDRQKVIFNKAYEQVEPLFEDLAGLRRSTMAE